jgi:hypothetical protein
VTWAFAYLVALMVGLVLAGVSGLLRDLRSISRHRHLIVPHPDQHSPFLDLLGRRLAIGFALFGAAGLLLGIRLVSQPWLTLGVAFAAGVIGVVIGCACYRRRFAPRHEGEQAIAVREIPAGGYGQVKIERRDGSIVLAAHNLDTAAIPAGCEVEVVDATQSVVTVRRSTPA